MKRIALVVVVALAALVAVPTVMAQDTYSLYGDATLVSPGNESPNAVKVTSDTALVGYGGIDFVIPAGTTFADFTTLSTDYMFEADDTCGVGSPRFQINVDSGSGVTGNIFVYIGPPPGYTDCPSGTWLNTGDLLEGANTIDTSQVGGTFYDPYTTAVANFGSYTVTGVQFVADSGYSFQDLEQTVLIDTTNVDGTIYTYETTSDLFEDLRATTVDVVENRKAERTLLAALDRAEQFNDDGRTNAACGAVFNYAYYVNLYEWFGVISSEDAEVLLDRAEALSESLCAPPTVE